MSRRFSHLTRAARIVFGAGLVLALLAAYGGWHLVAWIAARGNDTWVYESSSGWTERSTDPAPSMRTDAAMAYDPARRKVVLFGGRPTSAAESLDDTWTWDLQGWHSEGQAAHPPGLAAPAMAYDPQGKRMILFGGQTTLQRPPYGAPQPGCQVTASGGQKVPPPASCVTGPEPTAPPESADTWAYDGSWTRLAPLHQPPARQGAALAFDAASGRLILFGGSNAIPAGGGPQSMLGDTWAFEGGDWLLLTPAGAPSPRANSSIAESPAGPVLFGGSAGGALAGAGNGQALGDTWRWVGSRWEELAPAHSPASRFSAGMASSGPSGGPVMFGGQLGCGADHNSPGCSVSPNRDDTWKWDGRDWQVIDKGVFAAKPRSRSGASMAYFGATGAVVLFGGQDPHALALF
jgi:hypothetical protein